MSVPEKDATICLGSAASGDSPNADCNIKLIYYKVNSQPPKHCRRGGILSSVSAQQYEQNTDNALRRVR